MLNSAGAEVLLEEISKISVERNEGRTVAVMQESADCDIAPHPFCFQAVLMHPTEMDRDLCEVSLQFIRQEPQVSVYILSFFVVQYMFEFSSK